MGFFKKLKETFIYDDEEEKKDKDEIKKERIQVEIKAPAPKEDDSDEVDTRITKKDMENNEEKFNFPVFFDDQDFKDLNKNDEVVDTPKDKKEVKEYSGYNSEYKKTPYSNNNYSTTKKVDEKRIFHPTPIISPIYGVLDKNYHKEDIVHKGETFVFKDKDGLTIDDIRNKAFGTLEDELEDGLSSNTKTTISITKENIKEIDDEKPNDDIFDELEEDLSNTKDEIEDIKADEKIRTRYSDDKSYDDIMFDDLVPKEKNEEIEDSHSADFDIDYKELLNMTNDMYKKGDE